MTIAYGITPTGFARPTVLDLKSKFEGDQRAEISESLDLSTDSVIGQVNGIYARHLGIAWEALEIAYHAFDPDQAEDFLLVSLAKLTGTIQRPASPSEVDCTCNMDSGTVLLAGESFAHVFGKPDLRFTPKADFTAPSSGDHIAVRFVSEGTGPVEAPAGELTVIATTTVGWNSITNPVGAVLGRPIDSNEVLRERREEQLTRAGSATMQAIRADLLTLPDVKSVTMFENVGEVVDADGLPPHSFEAVIFDSGLALDSQIAQLIWDNKAGGIKSNGNTFGIAKDKNGDDQRVDFTRAAEVLVYLAYSFTPTVLYVGDGAFKEKVAARANALSGATQDVIASHLRSLPFELALGVSDVTALALGVAPAPVGTINLAVGVREIARFDSSRITVTHP